MARTIRKVMFNMLFGYVITLVMYWNDIQYCDLDKEDGDNHKAYYNNKETAKMVTQVYDRTLTWWIRYYSGKPLTTPATCRMENDIVMYTTMGIPKSTKIIQEETYRYEYCN